MSSSHSKRSELVKQLKIAGPLAVYYLTEVAMGVSNMVIVGRLGSTELAAVGLTVNMMIEFVLVCFGILSMVSVLSSQSMGAGKKQDVGLIVVQGFWVAGALAIVGLVFGFTIPRIFIWTGQDPEVIRLASEYIVWLVWFAPFALGFVVMRNFLVVLSKPHVVLYITIPALALNFLLNYAIVLGNFGFPQMGVAGAGIATTVINALMFFALLIYVSLDKECQEYRVFESIRQFNASICRSIFKLGTPAGATAFLEGGLFMVVGIVMGTLGADSLAANEILFHLLGTSFVIALAMGEAAAVRIAYNVGAHKPTLAQWNALSAVILGSIVMLSSACLLWFFPLPVIAIFIDVTLAENAETVAIATSLIVIAAVFQLFDGLQAVAAWCLRGLKDTLVPMWIATFGYWVCGLGGGYLAGFVWGYGAEGIWWGMAAGLTAAAILLSIRLIVMMRLPRLKARIEY